MASCWHCEPEERPTFTDILRQLDYFILHYKTNEMIHVDISDKNEWYLVDFIQTKLIYF